MQSSIDRVSVVFLGTSAGLPTLERNVSSLALKLDGEVYLVDCGEGTQHQLLRTPAVRTGQISKIFITHLHGDHILGLVGLLLTMSMNTNAEARHIELYGPKGLRELLATCLRLTYSELSYTCTVYELLQPHETKESENDIVSNEQGHFVNFIDGQIAVSAGFIKHTVPCLGYVFQEKPRRARLNPKDFIPHLKKEVNSKALQEQGYSSPLKVLSLLTADNATPLTLQDGTVLNPPPLSIPGRKITILGDTYDATGILSLCTESNLIVHESTNALMPGDTRTLDECQALAAEHGHSIPQTAGKFAHQAGCKHLVLNHLSARFKLPGDWDEIARQAEALSQCPVTIAHDFLEVDVPKAKD